MALDKSKKMYYTAYEYPYPCIYKLVFGDEFYIGQTINLKQRVQSHVSALNSRHCNEKMLEAYEKNGHDFGVEIVEVIPSYSTPAFLAERECHYIKSLKPTLNSEKHGNMGENTRIADRKMIREDLIMTNAEAVKRHHAKLDEFKIRPYKDEGQKIREAASKAGKSVQSYILDAVRTQMEIDERKK